MIFTNLLIKTYKYKNIYSKFPFFFPISVVSKTLLGKQMQIEVTQLISQYPANLILSSLIKKIPCTLHPHITQQITGPPSFTLKNHPSLNPRVSHPLLRNSKTECVPQSYFDCPISSNCFNLNQPHLPQLSTLTQQFLNLSFQFPFIR